jgi:hypothetical protein
VPRAQVNQNGFNQQLHLPYSLRLGDFSTAMDDIYVLLGNINDGLTSRGLLRIEESVRGAIYSGLLSDMLAAALAKHSLGLVKNAYYNGHPDLLPVGKYANDKAQSAEDGVEVKVTNKPGGGVDMHGARPAWYAIFRYETDHETQPVVNRRPTRFTHIWLAQLDENDFRKNPRGELGTRTATPHRDALKRLRESWVYRDDG